MPLLFLSLSLLNVFTIKYVHTYIFKGLYRDILELDTSETLLDFKCWFYMSIHTRLVHLLKHTCRCIVNKREAMPHFLLPAVLLHVLSWLVLDLAINCIFMTRENVTLNHLFVPLVTKRKRRLRWVPTTKYMLFKVYLIHALLVGNKMTLVLPVLPSCFFDYVSFKVYNSFWSVACVSLFKSSHFPCVSCDIPGTCQMVGMA